MPLSAYYDTIDPVTKKVVPQHVIKGDFFDLFQQDFDFRFGSLTPEEGTTDRRCDYIRSRFIFRWIMSIGEDHPREVRQSFYKLSEPCQSQILQFLQIMEEELWYEWRLRVFELQIK